MGFFKSRKTKIAKLERKLGKQLEQDKERRKLKRLKKRSYELSFFGRTEKTLGKAYKGYKKLQLKGKKGKKLKKLESFFGKPINEKQDNSEYDLLKIIK